MNSASKIMVLPIPWPLSALFQRYFTLPEFRHTWPFFYRGYYKLLQPLHKPNCKHPIFCPQTFVFLLHGYYLEKSNSDSVLLYLFMLYHTLQLWDIHSYVNKSYFRIIMIKFTLSLLFPSGSTFYSFLLECFYSYCSSQMMIFLSINLNFIYN